MAACAACGADNPEGARFCNQCGSRIEAPSAAVASRAYTPKHLADRILQNRAALIGERKQVTVLFADIKDSTVLAETAGAEAWHAILDRYFAILGAAVHRYEGTINQYTGDGIMALFGAPLALEDHAQRACFAALEAQAAVRAYADELRLASGLNISMRVGLNSGEVIVGRIGDDLRMDYTAQGLTVNLAARMEHICEPGRIWCTRATAALVEGYFALRDLGETAVAGASQPVRVYEVAGEGALTTRLARGLARGASSFVGREPELARLTGALEEARAGSGQIVAVVGEAGLGKSRLCHEFAQDCARRGVAVHRATGVPYAAAMPLLPLQMLTRSRLGIPEHATPAEVRRLAAGSLMLFDPRAADLLLSLTGFLGAGAGESGNGLADRQKLFEFLARFLPQAEAPQVLLVEDLHFADAGTAACLAALAARIAATPTLLLLNFRPEYAADWLAPIPHRRIAVTALGDAAIESLARELLGSATPECRLSAELRRRAGGNPFFVEEAVQALVESGHLAGQRGAYTIARPIAEWPMADTVHALLAARIDRLDEDLKALLHQAAVIGQSFRLEALVALAGREHEACAADLARLAAAGLVIAGEAPGEHRFAHPLMQDVAYRTQLETRRTAAHARLAEQLEGVSPLEAPPTEAALHVAHHWRRAREWERAGAWNLHAARWAAVRDLSTTAAQQRLALDNLGRAPPSPEIDRLIVGAHAGLIRQAQFTHTPDQDIDHHYAEGRRLAERAGDHAAIAELLVSYAGEHLRRGDGHAAVNFALESVDEARHAGIAREFVGRFRVLLLLTANAAGYPREGIAMLNRAGGEEWLTTPVGPDNFLSRGLYGYLLGWLGRLDEAAVHMSEAIDYTERHGISASWMYANQVELAWLSGEQAGVLGRAQEALRRAEAFGSSYFRAFALRALGSAHLQQGDAAAAVPLLEAARPLVVRGGNAHQFEATTLATLARAYIGCGDLERGRDTAEAAIASARRAALVLWEIAAWLALLELPHTPALASRAEEGLQRVALLLDQAGAEGMRPWWWLARARWDPESDVRAAAHAHALESFRAIGAVTHARRLAGELG